MLIQGQVGPSVLTDGTQAAPLRQGRTGEGLITQLHGKYYESNLRGSVFVATTTAATLSTLGTAVSFALTNPAGSTKNASIIRVEVGITTAPATPVVGIYAIYVNSNPVAAAVTGTALATAPALIGSNLSSSVKAFTTATLPATPTLYRVLQNKETGASTTIPYLPTFAIDFDGTMILGPGTALSVQQNTADATNASAIITVVWEEY